ncbi:hypothetical protein [Allorhodopirellula heiligendammensis]|uniref:Uncharacterized protein n=1 Tax=Allorhodopirellula heiligendammensis TaxID=2714739 RepID=A0A5C6BWW6_9BACT|nr:hypothetical protein [Allorhodopirellula heiligendammensis]TWU15169.1 hypothetical protein Poly21_23610 [Allorhodopirellula heiligendammensis]
MSFSSEAEFDANTPSSGADCAHDAIAPLDWHSLSQRFVDDVIETEFGMEIERDLAVMHDKLSQFATPISARRERR